MHFGLSEDEEAFAEAIRRLCEEQLPIDAMTEREGADDVVMPGSWTLLADAGVFGIRAPRRDGGLELGTLAAAVVFEELGRALLPGPLIGTELAASLLGGPVSLGAREGRRRVALLVVSKEAARSGARGPLVEHLGVCDSLVVVDGETVGLMEVSEVGAERIARTVDPLTPLWRVEELPPSEVVGGPAEARRWQVESAVLAASLCVGIAAASLEMAVGYAKQRHQFGRPIGSFQALKHICADMLVRVEEARCALWYACAALDGQGPEDPALLVPAAVLLGTRAAEANARDCIQVHGGIGFTWELPAHLYLKRARTLSCSVGPRAALAEAVAAAL